MKRALLAIAGTVSGLVLLLSFKTHPVPSAAGATRVTSGATTGSSGGTGALGSTGSTGSTGTATKTVTGSAVDTRWGPVQVQVVLTGGKIGSIGVLQAPDGNSRDQEINSYALPQLTQEALAAQSAQIDMVSGATYTSGGYMQSLQSALDKA